MDIATLSMNVSQSKVMDQVGTAVLSKVMDTNDATSEAMIKMMEQSVNPELGGNIDVSL